MIGAVPPQVPVATVSVSPSRATPETSGRSVFTGGAGRIASVRADVTFALPAEFVAVTTTRSVASTSPARATYVEPVAPAISVQVVPSAAQRRHWYV